MPEANIVGLASLKPAKLTLKRLLLKDSSPRTVSNKGYHFNKIKLSFCK